MNGIFEYIKKDSTDYLASVEAAKKVNTAARQTILTGKIDAAGSPAFLEATTLSNALVKASATAPLVATSAKGWASNGAAIDNVKMLTADAAIPALTPNANNYVMLDTVTGLPIVSLSPMFERPVKAANYNIVNAGNIISGGDYSGYPKENAVDGSSTTIWLSSQVGTGISGNAYIGVQKIDQKVEKVKFRTSPINADQTLSSVKAQYSLNGSTWNDIQTFNGLATTINTVVELNINDYSASGIHYFRLLANANTINSAAWALTDLEIYTKAIAWIASEQKVYGFDGNEANLVSLGNIVTGASTVSSVNCYPIGLSKSYVKDYGLFRIFSPAQTSNLVASNHVEYNESVGNLPLSLGTGQQLGKVKLKAGKRYKIKAEHDTSYSSDQGTVNLRIWDETNNVGLFGKQVDTVTNIRPLLNQYRSNIVTAYVEPIIDIEVSCRFIGVNLLTAITGWMEIEEI